MNLDREATREIVVSVVAVAVLVAVIVGIGVAYGGAALSPTGGLALVGALALFVVLMAVVGVVLAR
jgi:hypothetical protein